MSTSIKEVKTKKELKTFIRFYNELYAENKFFAPPLEFDELSTLTKGKNPAHDICDTKYWLAYHQNKVVGRIAAIINSEELSKSEHKIARFGFFDFIDDLAVSKANSSALVKRRGD